MYINNIKKNIIISYLYMEINYLYIIYIFVLGLILYNIYLFISKYKIIEGLENSSTSQPQTSDQIAILAYKNAGAIENIKEQSGNLKADIQAVYQNEATLKDLTTQLKDVIQRVKILEASNQSQDTQIKNLTSLETNNEKIANQANELSQDNQDRLMQLSKQAQQQGKAASDAADKLKSP